MASQDHQQLHFVLFPQLAPGHMLPMIDMARLFAERGILITIVTTPLNAKRFKPVIDRVVEFGLPIRLLQLSFPSAEAGLPERCENADSIPSGYLLTKFFLATTMLREPLERSFGELQPVPSCIISDVGFPWTSEIAKKFQIPRIVFHGTCCFSLFLCNHKALQYKLHESIKTDSELFVVPGLPDRIEITKAMIPGTKHQLCADMKEFCDQVRKAESTAYGVVVNSFEELEPKYVEEYIKSKTNKVWCIGPVSLCNKETVDKAERGNKASIDENQCLKWLDSREPCSVVYVCFGSLCRLTDSEMIELALGIEASGRPFVWVIRGGERYPELEKWLSEEEFEKRTQDRGLVIKGWAPQLLILSHISIGGFLTHCGWNSVLEGVAACVPMITWPMFAEQFFNEQLVVQVLQIGVRVRLDDVPGTKLAEEEKKIGRVSKKDEVEKAVDRVMDGGEEGEERRRRVRELAERAKNAMEEGGSSHSNLTLFIHDIMQHQESKTARNFPVKSKRRQRKKV